MQNIPSSQVGDRQGEEALARENRVTRDQFVKRSSISSPVDTIVCVFNVKCGSNIRTSPSVSLCFFPSLPPPVSCRPVFSFLPPIPGQSTAPSFQPGSAVHSGPCVRWGCARKMSTVRDAMSAKNALLIGQNEMNVFPVAAYTFS